MRWAEKIKAPAAANRPLLPAEIWRPVATPVSALMAVFVLGTVGYYWVGRATGHTWQWIDCMLMTSITLTTVGYQDYLGATDFMVGKIYTMGLIVTGMGVTLYSVSALTAFIVEGHLGRVFKRTRMQRRIESLVDHTIICGAGATGLQVVEEHLRDETPMVVVDGRADRLDRLDALYPDVPSVEGDATKEEVLLSAGLANAKAIVAALPTDKDNLFLLVTARFLHPNVIIVAKCVDDHSVGKFRAAGANHVVSPTAIGGRRIASQVLRPQMLDFLDEMLEPSANVQIRETTVQPNSELAGKTVADSRLSAKLGLLIVAMRGPDEDIFSYSPAGNACLEPGTDLICIGERKNFPKLVEMTRGR